MFPQRTAPRGLFLRTECDLLSQPQWASGRRLAPRCEQPFPVSVWTGEAPDQPSARPDPAHGLALSVTSHHSFGFPPLGFACVRMCVQEYACVYMCVCACTCVHKCVCLGGGWIVDYLKAVYGNKNRTTRCFYKKPGPPFLENAFPPWQNQLSKESQVCSGCVALQVIRALEENGIRNVLLTLVYPAAAAAESIQSCPTLCYPTDSSPLGSPIPGILQARIPEWVAISFSNAWKWKGKVKSLSCARLLETPWTAAYQAPPSMGFSRQENWSGEPLPSPSFLLHPIFLPRKAEDHWTNR